MGWPQWIFITLLIIGMVHVAAHDGEVRHYDFKDSVISNLIIVLLLIWGGFFK